MANNPDQKTSSSPIEQALSRFDLLIDKLAESPGIDAAPVSDEPKTEPQTEPQPEPQTPAADAPIAGAPIAVAPIAGDPIAVAEPEPSVAPHIAIVPELDSTVADEVTEDAEVTEVTEVLEVADATYSADATVAEQQPEPTLTLVPPLPTPDPARDFSSAPVVLSISGLVKRFDSTVAVDGIDLEVRAGQIFGLVGPNGAGKTTTLSMVTGVLRPDQGDIVVNGVNVWADAAAAKREIGILPDRLMLFDRLTGRQLLYYCGVLRGLDRRTVLARSADLIAAFDLGDAQDRLVTDYSAGMTRKIALAAAMIHSPRILILDEPFESVDSVSVSTVLDILRDYARAGGTVVLSSHSMDLVESFCDSVAIVAEGRILTEGPTATVRGDISLEERFITLIGEIQPGEDMEWLRSFSN